MIIDNLLVLRDKVWNVLQTCCIPAFYIVTPDPAFVLQMFANLVSCFSIWISYLSSSSFSLETTITLLRERYKVKQRKVGPKRERKMWKSHRSHEGLSTPFYTLRFWTAPVLPRARYASTQQTSRSRRQKMCTQF